MTPRSRPHRILRLAVLLLLALPFVTQAVVASPGASPAPTAAQDAAPDAVPRFEPSKCGMLLPAGWKDGVNVSCGYVVAPEDHANPAGPTIRLAVARFRSASATPAEPVFFLQGGPGGAALIPNIGGYAPLFTPTHDFILFDQRGVGQSQPSLTCPEVAAQGELDFAKPLSVTESEDHFVAATLRCRDRLVRRNTNFALYTTAQNAADVNDIRSALGYDKIDLLGVSYGTRLALTVMRDFPQIVADTVLDSVSPPQADQFGDGPVSIDRALTALFAGCAADGACNAAFPHVRDDFGGAVARLDATPVTITGPATSSGDGADPAYTLVLTGERFFSYLDLWLYSSSRLRLLPALFSQMKDGDTTLLTAMIRSFSGPSIAEGMAESVICNDYLPFSNRDGALAAAQGVMPEVARDLLPVTLGEYALCAQWPGGTPDPIEHQAIVSDIPTLVLESANDPVTPPSYGQMAAQTLSRAIFVGVPGIGHSVLANGGTCGASVMLAFYADPIDRPDIGCTAALGVRYLAQAKHYANPPPMTIDPARKYTATIVTTQGTVTADLYADVAPNTVNSFAFLAGEHFYDGLAFYNVASGFGMLSGDPTASGAGDAGYTFQGDPIPDGLNYEKGSLVMAYSGSATDGSNFLISVANLGGRVAKGAPIFGKVSGGAEVLDRIMAIPSTFGIDNRQTRPIEPVYIVSVSITAA